MKSTGVALMSGCRFTFILMKRSPTLVALCALTPFALAANLGPGDSATVNPGTAPETWTLESASLSVLAGAETLGINARAGSTVSLDGASVNSGAQPGVSMIGSNATIRNSTISSTSATGLQAVRALQAGAAGSLVEVSNSTISGIGRGVTVSSGSTVTLTDSTITGLGAQGTSIAGSGLGVSITGGEAILRGSNATGSRWGAGLFALNSDEAAPRLVLDNAGLTSQEGSAIVVGNLRGEAMQADIVIANGSQLNAANQTLIEVGLPSDPAGAIAQARVLIDASSLTGNISAATGAVADVTLANAAALTGDLNNLNSLALDASTVVGNLNQPLGSSATASLANGSRFTGNFNNVGTLTADASAIEGNVLSAAGSSTRVALGNASSLDGNVTNAASLSLDNSRMTGDMTQDVPGSGALNLANGAEFNGTARNVGSTTLTTGSRLTGDVVDGGTLSLDASSLQGNVLSAAGSGTRVALGNASSLDGNVTNAASLSLDNSRMTGDMTQDVPGSGALNLANGAEFNGTARNVGSTTLTTGSRLTGDVIDGGTLSLDASSLQGNVLSAAGSGTRVALGNGSTLDGNMNNAASLALDNSRMTGDVTQDAPGSGTLNLANSAEFNGTARNVGTTTLTTGSRLTGDVIDGGTLSLDASSLQGNVLSGTGSTTAIRLNNASTLDGNVNNVASLSLDNSRMTGDMTQDAPGSGALSLSNGSLFTGTVRNVGATTIASNARLNMINDSSVGALSLDGGTVDLRAGQAGFRTLTATSLQGAGTFVLGTDLAAHQSDLVNIEGQAQGQHGLLIQNTGAEPLSGDQPQRVVHTEGGPAQFSLISETGTVDVGAYSYLLQQRDTDWYLAQAETPIISPSATTAIAVFSAAPSVWYGELTTLRSRMGELRDGGAGQGGVWARTYANRYRVSTADQVDYQQTQQGISFGIDTALPAESGQWLVGVMGGYSDSELNMRLGSNGRVDSFYLGLYSTWLTDSGYYLDAVIKANRFDNKADVRMSDGNKAEGDYSNYGVGGQVEAGRHIKLDDSWFIEPYAQVAALWVEGENYRLDNDLRASSNKADSLLGKVGTHIGRTIPLQSGGFVQPYVKVAAAREFARNNEVKVNDNTFHDDLSGARAEFGGGVVAKISGTLQAHVDVDYSTGKHIEQPWGVNVGVRFSW
ncbi:autotransporter outer membrane beta-barrel domain-containing protein [Pseudomonas parafulva]|uniref:Autotransporter outer membrane beta-barrel domain-containing protein n=1 Tax=Pseudomonas parafulva TaxID=157782 RepID=A0AAI8PA07_9PSED|nr:autotransporter outer membrane beta-barrel domain-containing protein [Pseudomonas parafulva]